MIPYLFEGDIVLTEQQVEELVRTMERELLVKESMVKGIRKVPVGNHSDPTSPRDKRTMASTLVLLVDFRLFRQPI